MSFVEIENLFREIAFLVFRKCHKIVIQDKETMREKICIVHTIQLTISGSEVLFSVWSTCAGHKTIKKTSFHDARTVQDDLVI